MAMAGLAACGSAGHHTAQLAAPAGSAAGPYLQAGGTVTETAAGHDDIEPVVGGQAASSFVPVAGGAGVTQPGTDQAAAAAPAPPVSPGQAWAVIIGISQYQGSTHPTYGGSGDAAAFNTALRQAGWPADHIRLLVDGAATAGNMRSAMQWLVDHSASGSFSVFHYSGHVKQTDPHSEWLWPVDNAWISDTDFAHYMSQLRGRAWIDVSGCESQGFDKGVSSPSRFFTSSSRENEKSYEVPDWHESVWTGFEIRQGILEHAADRRGSGHVSIQQAARYGAANAPAYTANQQPYGPQHPYLAGGDGTDWYLDFPNASAAPSQPANPGPAPASPPAGGSPGKPGPGPGTPPSQDPCGNLTLNVVHC